MNIILIVLHVILSLGIITLVLLQKGSGASAGASFGGGGGGGAGSVFGATGSANFLSKTTAIFAIGFFVNSIVLAYLAANRDMQVDSVLDAFLSPKTEISVPVDGSPLETDVIPDAAIPEAVEAGAIETDAGNTEIPPAAGKPVMDKSAAEDIPPPGE